MGNLIKSAAELRRIVADSRRARKVKQNPHVFAHEQEWIRRIVKGIADYYKAYGKRPSNRELASVLGCSPITISKYRERAQGLIESIPCPMCGSQQRTTI